MNHGIKDKLREKGVHFPLPETVYIGEDVNPERISGNNVTIHPGCRITGKDTLILPGAEIGREAPVTMDNTLVGSNTKLHGGFFKNAVFAGDNEFGSCAHVRPGTILEEQASAAHSVGLKQTLLFPFVTLGSLINFCDCFMAGGTSRKDHSEVGSSFIHFNYTPNQDKATPSMFGNVSQGVMLDQPPIFLGGQGGIVGPLRLGFGCVTAAGSIIRKDEPSANRLILGGTMRPASIPRPPAAYTQVKRIFTNNILYISGLIALKVWYVHVRPMFTRTDQDTWLVRGMQTNLEQMIQERIGRLQDFCEKAGYSTESPAQNTEKNEPAEKQPHTHIGKELAKQSEYAGTDQCVSAKAENFISLLEKAASQHHHSYISTIQSLDPETKAMGSQWLSSIEDQTASFLPPKQ